MENLFHAYWWLIFPVLGMAMGFYAIHADFRHKSDMLKLVKSYVDQGKEPPEALLAKLDKDNRKSAKSGRMEIGSTAITFAALAAAFAYFGINGGHEVFIALAIGFGIGAVGSLIGFIMLKNQPRN